MINALVVLSEAAEHGAEHSGAPSPYLVGGIALGILVAALVGLVTFGGGREHS